jgi:hypothetical protein
MTEKDKNSIGRKRVTIDQDSEKDVMNNRTSKKLNRTYVQIYKFIKHEHNQNIGYNIRI